MLSKIDLLQCAFMKTVRLAEKKSFIYCRSFRIFLDIVLWCAGKAQCEDQVIPFAIPAGM